MGRDLAIRAVQRRAEDTYDKQRPVKCCLPRVGREADYLLEVVDMLLRSSRSLASLFIVTKLAVELRVSVDIDCNNR